MRITGRWVGLRAACRTGVKFKAPEEYQRCRAHVGIRRPGVTGEGFG